MVVGASPPKRRRKKRKAKATPQPPSSATPSTARKSPPNKRKKRDKREGVRLSGVLVLVGIGAFVVSIAMYMWAAGEVREFISTRKRGVDAVLSAPTVILSAQSPGSLGVLSPPTWRRIFSAHGYTESSSRVARTYFFDPAQKILSITQPGGIEIEVGKDGRLKSRDSEGRRNDARQIVFQPVPLGNYQSEEERAGLAVPLAAFSPSISRAIIAVEDERFYSHFGIDLIGLGRAILVNIAAGRFSQGGSTLTQQLAKNIFLSAERSLIRKFKELFLSLALERMLSKQQLLELYLNEVYLGSQFGNPIRGVPAAALWLFNKAPGSLTLSESALIAGIIQAPSTNNPLRRPQNAEARRRVALQRLLYSGAITQAEWKSALADRPALLTGQRDSPLSMPSAGLAPYVASLIRSRENQQHRTTAAQTTISPPLQRCAEQAVSWGAHQVARRMKRSDFRVAPQIGFVTIDVDSGAAVAVVGGTNFAINKIDHATDLKRQFGSTVKPFVYLRAFEHGTQLSSRLLDEQLAAGKWNPENYDRRYRGVVTARYALENSLNLPTIRLAQRLGLSLVARTFADFHLTATPPATYPALAVGALEGTLYDLTNAYAALARGGVFKEAYLTTAPETKSLSRRIADERAAFLVTNALQGVIQRGTARGLNAGDFPSVAGKTGTSDSTRDAWFVGYTPTHAFGVWTGFDDNKPLGLTGGAAAAPIAGEFLRCASELIPKRKFIIPAGVTLRAVDDGDDSGSVQEFFIERPTSGASSSTSASSSSRSKSWFERFGW